jgi:hypothetical protein
VKKHNKMITGYYIDLPTGYQTIAVNGGEEVAVDQYTGGIVTPETKTHYGLVEWDATTEISVVEVNGQPVDVQPLIAGHHPVAKPK